MKQGEDKAEARLNLEFPARAQTPEGLYYEDKLRMTYEAEDRRLDELVYQDVIDGVAKAEAKLERQILGLD